MVETGNNAIGNRIRPVVLGGENYLFAGLHDAAQQAAVISSFFAILMFGTCSAKSKR